VSFPEIISARKQPPPLAKFPTIRARREDTIYHEGDIVAFAGGTWQALRDTARAPEAQDWACLATPGNSLTVATIVAWMSLWSTARASLR